MEDLGNKVWMRMSVQSYFSGPQDFYMEKVPCFSWSLILKLVRGSLIDSKNRSNKEMYTSAKKFEIMAQVAQKPLRHVRYMKTDGQRLSV